MLGRRVWSDEEVQKVASEFLCVADEVWTLEHLDTPGGRVFRNFGKRMPAELWDHPNTKQGVYCMTPEGDFLSAHYARHDKEVTITLLKKALGKWREIAAQKGLSPKPVPPARSFSAFFSKPGALGLQINARDLPLGKSHPGLGGYTRAWNQNWIEFTSEEAAGFLPAAKGKTEVPAALARKLFREALVDNVRGQSTLWPDESIEKAVLTREAMGPAGDSVTVRLEGEFAAREPRRSYEAKLYGKVVYDARAKRFTSFELAAVGVRTGGAGVTFRDGEGPSALGICLTLERPDGGSGK